LTELIGSEIIQGKMTEVPQYFKADDISLIDTTFPLAVPYMLVNI
jgi:hypothetical protein